MEIKTKDKSTKYYQDCKHEENKLEKLPNLSPKKYNYPKKKSKKERKKYKKRNWKQYLNRHKEVEEISEINLKKFIPMKEEKDNNINKEINDLILFKEKNNNGIQETQINLSNKDNNSEKYKEKNRIK